MNTHVDQALLEVAQLTRRTLTDAQLDRQLELSIDAYSRGVCEHSFLLQQMLYVQQQQMLHNSQQPPQPQPSRTPGPSSQPQARPAATPKAWLSGPPQGLQNFGPGKGGKPGGQPQAFQFGQPGGKSGGYYFQPGKGKNSGKGKNQGKGKEGKNQGKGKGKDTDFFRREIWAQSLEDALARMQRFMDRNPNYVFQPKPGVPADQKDLYDYLGEDGEQLYKNLKHHLQTEEANAMMPRILQFMAQSSTWRADRLNFREQQRQLRKEGQFRGSEQLSTATGFSRASTVRPWSGLWIYCPNRSLLFFSFA